MKKLMIALKNLGVTGKVTTKQHDRWTIEVTVNGKYFGLWDTKKNTFVE